jgi:hypothetical protein
MKEVSKLSQLSDEYELCLDNITAAKDDVTTIEGRFHNLQVEMKTVSGTAKRNRLMPEAFEGLQF